MGMRQGQHTLRQIVEFFPNCPEEEREHRLQEWARELLTIISEEKKRLQNEKPP